MKKPVYLGLSVSELSKIVMYEFWYDYVKQNYGKNEELCYMDINSFIVYTKAEDTYAGIAKMLKQDLIRQTIN